MFAENANRSFVKAPDRPYIITAAQNNTVPHEQALFALEMYADNLGAELIVLPIRYNKKAFSPAAEDEHEQWHPLLMPYMVHDPFRIEDICVYASSHILPTAKYPVRAGCDLNGGERVTVVASPKMQQQEMPRGEGQGRSTVYTTGAITNPNYLSSRAGSVAEKCHKIAALLIEGGKVFPIEFETYLGWKYDYKVAVFGDIHAESLDQEAFDRTLERAKHCGVKTAVVHDLLDFRNRNGHERNSPLHLYMEKDRSVLDDLKQVADVLEKLMKNFSKIFVVRSNHDDMLDRWLNDTSYSPHTDPANSKLFYQLQLWKLEAADLGETPNMLQVAMQRWFFPDNKKITFLSLSDSLRFCGVECGTHGHKGVNGARSGLQKLNRPMVVGHSHSGGRLDDFVTVGTMAKLRQGYNRGGGSTWTQASAFICSSGRITLVEP